MKKINLLAVLVAGVFVAACNGGGSSNNSDGGGGSTSDACANGAATCGAPAGSVPTVYLQAITPRVSLGSSLTTATLYGTLSSTTNLYLSSAESYPLTFTVTGNTVNITVDFTIVADDANITVGSKLPTMTPQQCVFTVDNPAQCNLSITLNGSPVGKYKVIPHVTGATEFAGVEINFQAPTQLTLPLGTYTAVGDFVHPVFRSNADGSGMVLWFCDLVEHPSKNGSIVNPIIVNTMNGAYWCGDYLKPDNTRETRCFNKVSPNNTSRYPTMNLPSSTSIYTPGPGAASANLNYTNSRWENNSLTRDETLSYPACNGLIGTMKWTLISKSTNIPGPIEN